MARQKKKLELNPDLYISKREPDERPDARYTPDEKLLVATMIEQAWPLAEIQEWMYTYFQCWIGMATLRSIAKSVRTGQKFIELDDKLLKERSVVVRVAFEQMQEHLAVYQNDEIQRAEQLKKKADLQLMKKLDEEKMDSKELLALSHAMFERQRLLEGKPLDIKRYSHFSNAELIGQLADTLNKHRVEFESEGAEDSRGTLPSQTGGADSILHAASETEGVHSE